MAFKGLRVFMSRKDFSPQFISSAHDILRENGAEVCICSNVSANASTDFHVFPPTEHEKLVEYISNGCNVIGPECLLGCAKEHRPFPRRGYTCCLAMEGVKVLATGFEKAEKADIERIVTSMCGKVETKVSTDISFVIAKDVLAAKYKFAMNNLRRPILKIDWLFRCRHEHRLVSCEPFRLPPFKGLVICATNIPLDERKEIEDACIENGGSYSADLTKKCTHLIANVPQGDKFRVARRWGTVKIVNRQWFIQCLTAKACLDEDLFPVNSGKEKPVTVSQLSGPPPNILTSLGNSKLETVVSSAMSVVSNTNSWDQGLENNNGVSRPDSSLLNEEQSLPSNGNENSGLDVDPMYLSNCRVYFCGFSAPDLRKYVNMVREGGGTRFMELNDRVTHIIFGESMESLHKDLRQRIGVGSMHCVFPLWLEECYQQRKEITVLQKHLVMEGIFEKRYNSQEKWLTESVRPPSCGKQQPPLPECSELGLECAIHEEECTRSNKFPSGQNERLYTSQQGHARDSENTGQAREPMSLGDSKVLLEIGNLAATERRLGQHSIISGKGIFEGYAFSISNSFPLERRAEIVQWVREGGGFMEIESCSQTDARQKIDFVVVTHGDRLKSPSWEMNAKPVSSHWIRFCLEEKKLLDLESHVLYQPLQCQVPFPGFEALRICVSQYEEKERLLLRNLSFVLGAKFTEKLTKKVTHLLCKVKDGQKYHAACNWGISIATADWLFSCSKKDTILPLKGFQPKEVSDAEEGRILGMTQGLRQTSCPERIGSEGTAGLEKARFQVAKKSRKNKRASETSTIGVGASVAHLSETNKYFLMTKSMPSQDGASLLDPWDSQTAQWSGVEALKDKISDLANTPPMNSKEEGSCNIKRKQSCSQSPTANIAVSPVSDLGEPATIEQSVVALNEKETQHSSDVAAAIEGLLAQTSKLKGQTGVDSLIIEQEISPEHTTIKRTREERCFKRPKHSTVSSENSIRSPSLKCLPRDLPAFDESQMESQVIGYGEDHSGKELIIERVRTRSMSTTGDSGRPSATSWTNDGLGRLFKVAEANK